MKLLILQSAFEIFINFIIAMCLVVADLGFILVIKKMNEREIIVFYSKINKLIGRNK